MAELIVPPSPARAHRQGLARFLEGGQPVDPRPPARADRHAARRDRVPGRADDHQDRPARPADVHRLPARHHRARTRRAGPARLTSAARGGRRRGAEADPAQPPRRRPAAADRCTVHAGPDPEAPDERRQLLDLAIDELATGLEEIRELAGGLHPAVSPSAVSPLRCRRSPSAPPCRSSCRRCRVTAAGAGRGGRLLRGRGGAGQRPQARRRDARSPCAPSDEAAALSSRSRTTASAAPTTRARGSAGSPTGWKRLGEAVPREPTGGGTRPPRRDPGRLPTRETAVFRHSIGRSPVLAAVPPA